MAEAITNYTEMRALLDSQLIDVQRRRDEAFLAQSDEFDALCAEATKIEAKIEGAKAGQRRQEQERLREVAIDELMRRGRDAEAYRAALDACPKLAAHVDEAIAKIASVVVAIAEHLSEARTLRLRWADRTLEDFRQQNHFQMILSEMSDVIIGEWVGSALERARVLPGDNFPRNTSAQPLVDIVRTKVARALARAAEGEFPELKSPN